MRFTFVLELRYFTHDIHSHQAGGHTQGDTAMIWQQTLVVASLACFSGFSVGLSGFGGAIVFQIMWNLVGRIGITGVDGNIEIAVGVLLANNVLELSMLLFSGVVTKYAVKRIAVLQFPSASLMTYLGGVALVSWDTTLLQRILGVLFVSVAVFQYARRRILPSGTGGGTATDDKTSAGAEPEPANSCTDQAVGVLKDPTSWAAILVGSASGFLKGAFGTSGPPWMLFYAALGFNKQQVRSTFSLQNVLSLPISITTAIALGIWRTDRIANLLASPVMAAIGLFVGNKMHEKIDSATVLTMLNVFVLAGSVPLLGTGDGSIFGFVTLGVYIVIGVGFVAWEAWLRLRTKRPESKPKQEEDAEVVFADPEVIALLDIGNKNDDDPGAGGNAPELPPPVSAPTASPDASDPEAEV